jgi:hypothetical protein
MYLPVASARVRPELGIAVQDPPERPRTALCRSAATRRTMVQLPFLWQAPAPNLEDRGSHRGSLLFGFYLSVCTINWASSRAVAIGVDVTGTHAGFSERDFEVRVRSEPDPKRILRVST